MSDLKRFDFKKIRVHAQEPRKNMTESEKMLWYELRDRKLSGFKFLRQHPIIYEGNLRRYNYFIVDFYCDAAKSVIELDGPIHNESAEYDQYRDSELKHLGLRVLRLRNEELINMQKVLSQILSFLVQSPDKQ